MEQRQVEGIDAYNFPANLLGHPLLAWMGDDYVRFVATALLLRFREQDADTEMLAIKREDRPQFLTCADERTGTARGVVAAFNLQVLLRASNGQCWRLRGDGKFTADRLDRPGQAAVSVEFDIRSSEEAV